MALEFIKTINDIDDLEDKLLGKLPVNREELILIVNTHGRKDRFCIYVDDIEYFIKDQKSKECLPLENLDVSKIQDFSQIFFASPFNGDLSKWDFSNAKSLVQIFMCSDFNNDSLKNLDFKDIKHAGYMFYDSKFCGDISGWINYENTAFYSSFNINDDFKYKYYPNAEKFLIYTDSFINWLNENLENIKRINTSDEMILDYFNFDNDIILER